MTCKYSQLAVDDSNLLVTVVNAHSFPGWIIPFHQFSHVANQPNPTFKSPINPQWKLKWKANFRIMPKIRKKNATKTAEEECTRQVDKWGIKVEASEVNVQREVCSHRICSSLRNVEVAWNKLHNVQQSSTSAKSSIWGGITRCPSTSWDWQADRDV